MILRNCILQNVVLCVLCCLNIGDAKAGTLEDPTSEGMVNQSFGGENWTSPPLPSPLPRPSRHSLCFCRKYSCSCCINFSFIRKWKALGCFNIRSLPGNLNIVLSFTFNNRHLAMFDIAGSRPMAFCKRLHLSRVEACLVIYNVHTNTPHDIMVCLYMELRVGQQSIATIHLDCIRKLPHQIQFIPIFSHQRKGSVLDVHVLPNDTALTILRQEFHWARGSESVSNSESDSVSDSVSDSENNTDSDSGSDESSESVDSSEEEEEIIALKRTHRFFHWLRRIFWWRNY